MAVDIYLVIPPSTSPGRPISAEPIKDPYFANTFRGASVVEIRQFSLGAENPATIGSATTGAGAGKAKLNELVIEKSVDKLSGSLFAYSASGGHFPRVQLYVRQDGGAPTSAGAKPYLVYGFDTVFVSKIDWSCSSGDDEPLETVTFAYGALVLGYYPKKPDGTFEPAVKIGWSQVLNKEAPPDPVLTGF